jgi:hypothetical protein
MPTLRGPSGTTLPHHGLPLAMAGWAGVDLDGHVKNFAIPGRAESLAGEPLTI